MIYEAFSIKIIQQSMYLLCNELFIPMLVVCVCHIKDISKFYSLSHL